jgi:hypothetical protein
LDFTPPRLPRHSFTLGLGGTRREMW